LLRSAEVMHLVARRAAEFGVEVDGSVRFNLAQAVERKDEIVRGIIDGIYAGLDRRREDLTFIRGDVRFVGDHEVDAGEGRLSFEKAIIATGARSHMPAIDGIENIEYLTNRTALLLDCLPESLIVIGGGYVGVEFAQMYGRFGTDVTLIGRNDQLAPGEDRELTELLASYLRQEGMEVHTGAPVVSARVDGNEKVITALVDGAEAVFRGEQLLVAAGRIANIDSLALEAAGVTTDDRGFVHVDDQLRTSRDHIWAIGDVKGGWMFTHVATYDGPIAALNAVKGLGRTTDYRVVPRAIFSDPTLAAVGLTEEEARARGHDVVVGSVPADGARAKAVGGPTGPPEGRSGRWHSGDPRLPHPSSTRRRLAARGRGGDARQWHG